MFRMHDKVGRRLRLHGTRARGELYASDVSGELRWCRGHQEEVAPQHPSLRGFLPRNPGRVYGDAPNQASHPASHRWEAEREAHHDEQGSNASDEPHAGPDTGRGASHASGSCWKWRRLPLRRSRWCCFEWRRPPVRRGSGAMLHPYPCPVRGSTRPACSVWLYGLLPRPIAESTITSFGWSSIISGGITYEARMMRA